MKKFYIIFNNGKVWVVLAKYFGLMLISPTLETLTGPMTKGVQTYAFYDDTGIIVGQFFYCDVLCITNEEPK